MVEFNPITGTSDTSNEIVEFNVKSYIRQIAQAKVKVFFLINITWFYNFCEFFQTASAQIIVFPEYGLTGLVDDPENYAITIPQVGTSNFSTDAAFSVSLIFF